MAADGFVFAALACCTQSSLSQPVLLPHVLLRLEDPDLRVGKLQQHVAHEAEDLDLEPDVLERPNLFGLRFAACSYLGTLIRQVIKDPVA